MRLRVARHTDRLEEVVAFYHHSAPDPHPESLLVLYFDNQEDIDTIAERIAQPEVVTANPYWHSHARASKDPDGFQLLLALTS